MSDEYRWREKWQEKTRDGEKIHWVIETPDGGFVARLVNGLRVFVNAKGVSDDHVYALLPLPAPPRPWEKAEDVPEEAEWVRHDDLQGPRRITGITANGLYLATNFHCWETLALFSARWSTTRTGEYRECKVEGGGK